MCTFSKVTLNNFTGPSAMYKSAVTLWGSYAHIVCIVFTLCVNFVVCAADSSTEESCLSVAPVRPLSMPATCVVGTGTVGACLRLVQRIITDNTVHKQTFADARGVDVLFTVLQHYGQSVAREAHTLTATNPHMDCFIRAIALLSLLSSGVHAVEYDTAQFWAMCTASCLLDCNVSIVGHVVAVLLAATVPPPRPSTTPTQVAGAWEASHIIAASGVHRPLLDDSVDLVNEFLRPTCPSPRHRYNSSSMGTSTSARATTETTVIANSPYVKDATPLAAANAPTPHELSTTPCEAGTHGTLLTCPALLLVALQFVTAPATSGSWCTPLVLAFVADMRQLLHACGDNVRVACSAGVLGTVVDVFGRVLANPWLPGHTEALEIVTILARQSMTGREVRQMFALMHHDASCTALVGALTSVLHACPEVRPVHYIDFAHTPTIAAGQQGGNPTIDGMVDKDRIAHQLSSQKTTPRVGTVELTDSTMMYCNIGGGIGKTRVHHADVY